MLAQGQSSSAKRGGLAVVSSGLIFQKKKFLIVYSIERVPIQMHCIEDLWKVKHFLQLENELSGKVEHIDYFCS